jgi:hypothetical protein
MMMMMIRVPMPMYTLVLPFRWEHLATHELSSVTLRLRRWDGPR